MDEEQKTKLRVRIENEIALCNENISRLEVSVSPIAPDNAVGRLSHMGGIIDQSVSNAMLDQNRDKLVMIEQALKKIDQPGFGKCVACGSDIPIERIMAIPECIRCVRCAS